MNILLVYVLCASRREAEKIAGACVKSGLAACANVLPAAKSFFHWKGKFEECREWPVFMKTTEKNFPALEKKIRSLHSYRVPCVVAVEISKSSKPYFEWVLSSSKTK